MDWKMACSTLALGFALFLSATIAAAQQLGTSRQSGAIQEGEEGRVPGRRGVRHAKPEACWQKAGITQSVMEQRRSIVQKAHAEVQGVCNDSSLSEQQKFERIRQIQRSAAQQSMGFITPEQRNALQECWRANRGLRSPGGVHPGVGPRTGQRMGPCGELLPTPAPKKPADQGSRE